MQERQHRPDYPTVDEPSVASALESAGNAGTAVSILKPYKPPNPPHGLPHVVQFATVSSMNLPIQVRFLIIILARYANLDGVASVAVTTLCELCEIGSKNTVERWLALAAQIGILRKEPGKGGKDRKSNTYTFLGKARNWVPLPVGHPETVPIIALAEARRVIEELQVKAARVEDLETEVDQLRAELTLLRNGRANGHPEVTNGRDEETPAPTSRSYESQATGHGHENYEAIGHFGVTNGETSDPAQTPADSYESPGSSRLQDREGAIGHSEVTNGAAVPPAETGSDSYETTDPIHPQGDNGAIGHSEVTNGDWATEADSYETPTPQGDDGAIGHSSVTNGEPSPAADTGSRNSEDTRPSSPLGEKRAHRSLRSDQWADRRGGVPVAPGPGGTPGHGIQGPLSSILPRRHPVRSPLLLRVRLERDRAAGTGRNPQERGPGSRGQTAGDGGPGSVRPQGSRVLPRLRQPVHHARRRGLLP